MNEQYKQVLYKKDSAGKIRQWTVSVVDNGDAADVRVESGLMDGKKVEQVTPVALGKNVGRSNETSYLQQAIMEAQSKVASQVKDGYVSSLEDVKESGVKGSGAAAVMLAKPYDPYKKQSGSKDLEGYKLQGVEIGAQRKFDGARRAALVTRDSAVMHTRSGDVSDTLPHIEEQLIEAYRKAGYDAPLWVDGEAYTDKLTFNEINGITRKGIKGPKDAAMRQLIEYHVYDVMLDLGYRERYEHVKRFDSEHLKPVETIFMTADADELRRLHDQFVMEGYEGLMIRELSAPYINKRSQSLLKYKDFEDDNFLVLDVLPTEDGTRAGKFVVKMDRPAHDSKGKVIESFDPTPVGPHKDLKEWLERKDLVIGRMVKVNFFGRSVYGVPRFPRVKGFVLNQ